MGCTTSRIDETELVLRCKNRKRLMKQAVGYRQEFAIAHIAYIQALKSIGMALRQFAGDHKDTHTSLEVPDTPLLSLRQTSSSSPDAAPASTLSPPLSPSAPSPHLLKGTATSAADAVIDTSSTASASSPQSPDAAARQPPEPSPPRNESSIAAYNEKRFMSSESSDSPLYSPGREEHDDVFMSLHSSPPSLSLPSPPSPQRDSSWDIFGIFHPPPIPFHLQEYRRMRQTDEEEDLERVREEEGIPELEEEDPKIGGTVDQEDEAEVQDETTKFSEAAMQLDSENGGSDCDTGKVSEKVEGPIYEKALVAIEEAALDVEKENEEDKKELILLVDFREKNILEVARQVDDQFIRAYASGRNVAGMLETTKVRHHKAIFQRRDSARVFNAITWHWSSKTPLVVKDAGGEDSDVAECGMTGSHSSTLERLYAWERKMYDEVKAGEIIRMAFDRKCELLKSQNARGEDPNVIDKTRAAVKNLDTQLIVALQAIHSISLRIQKLTNEELYPQLLEILGGLINMWKVMLDCHKTQADIALEMKSLDGFIVGEAMDAHRKATIELENELNSWQIHFSRWISSQKYYIDSLLSWLRLCRMEPETDKKGRIVSPYWAGGPPAFSLIKSWHHALKHLQEREEVVDAILNFSTVLHSLQLEQMEDSQQKKEADLLKDFDRRTLSFETMDKKFVESLSDTDEKQETSDISSTSHEGGLALNNIESGMEEENHRLTVGNRRETMLASFKANLPTIFEAMASFADVAYKEYEKLQPLPEIRKIQHF